MKADDRPRHSVAVITADEQSDIAVDVDRWATFAATVMGDLEVGDDVELGLTFVDSDTMAELNSQHMGTDGPTDVLSFPLDNDDALRGPVLIGDLVICPAVAAQNAPAHAGDLESEFALLIVHGLLHLRGHDHATHDEAIIMRDREAALLARHYRPIHVGTEIPQEDQP